MNIPLKVSWWFIISPCLPPPRPTPCSDNHWSAFCRSGVVPFSRILHEETHTVCAIFCLSSFTQHNYLEINPVVAYTVYSSYCWEVFHCAETSPFISPFTRRLGTFELFPGWAVFEIKQEWTRVGKFVYSRRFLFSGASGRGMAGLYGGYVFNFMRNCSTVFPKWLYAWHFFFFFF